MRALTRDLRKVYFSLIDGSEIVRTNTPLPLPPVPATPEPEQEVCACWLLYDECRCGQGATKKLPAMPR